MYIFVKLNKIIINYKLLLLLLSLLLLLLLLFNWEGCYIRLHVLERIQSIVSDDTEKVRYPLSYRETPGFKQSHFYGCDNFIKTWRQWKWKESNGGLYLSGSTIILLYVVYQHFQWITFALFVSIFLTDKCGRIPAPCTSAVQIPQLLSTVRNSRRLLSRL